MITYSWQYMRDDDLPVRGNAMASGDEAADRACEDAILAALDRGDDWHWARVRVTATLKVGDDLFTGDAYLGRCSYASEAELRRDTFEDFYGNDLKIEAQYNLRDTLMRAAVRGEAAKNLLANFDKLTL